ncbi:hypothetical protein PHMEG_00024135 [Phytophthora megakarya]|uniref:Uncharacterized protein n=1 Tax=Phytophthora megakarya TaxID=4795 RepID=A0A225VGN9_9STRA|nr:hypothetical protein PHMEG_00024135 [Phytophthora megakarya]
MGKYFKTWRCVALVWGSHHKCGRRGQQRSAMESRKKSNGAGDAHFDVTPHALESSKQKNSELPKYDAKFYFLDAYTIDKMHEAFDSISVALPLYNTLKKTEQVNPPPLYRQVGRKLQQTKEPANGNSGVHRKRNRGECAELSTRRVSTASVTAGDDDDHARQIADFFDDHLKGPSTSKQDTYKCSRCGQALHNIRRCTASLAETERVGVSIIPGDYIVGKSPFIVLGKSSEYEIEGQQYQ